MLGKISSKRIVDFVGERGLFATSSRPHFFMKTFSSVKMSPSPCSPWYPLFFCTKCGNPKESSGLINHKVNRTTLTTGRQGALPKQKKYTEACVQSLIDVSPLIHPGGQTLSNTPYFRKCLWDDRWWPQATSGFYQNVTHWEATTSDCLFLLGQKCNRKCHLEKRGPYFLVQKMDGSFHPITDPGGLNYLSPLAY